MVGDRLPFFPYDAVQEASDNGCASISYTYTEPTIFFEFARTIAMEARKKGLKNVFVTNGFMARRALDDASCWLDAANVDVKAYSDEYYRETCKGRLKPVLDAIAYMKSIGIWVEATTLVVPDKNDSDEQLKGIADFLSETGADIPWRISRFHPDYRFDSHSPTPLETLNRAERIGREAGLKYVYKGNIAEDRNTFCPKCGKIVAQRTAMGLGSINMESGKCRFCGEKIHGVWE